MAWMRSLLEQWPCPQAPATASRAAPGGYKEQDHLPAHQAKRPPPASEPPFRLLVPHPVQLCQAKATRLATTNANMVPGGPSPPPTWLKGPYTSQRRKSSGGLRFSACPSAWDTLPTRARDRAQCC